jgi:SAM-dependent methyltransferase
VHRIPYGQWAAAFAAGRRALRGDLPPRYDENLEERFRRHFLPFVVPGAQVLDVGSGKRPILRPGDRGGIHYVGLDVSLDELSRAPQGGYDEITLGDATVRVRSLEGRFDIVLTRWLLEHVRPIDAALENFRSYLRPSGRFAALLAGGRSIGALANRLLGTRLGSAALSRLTYRTPDSIFPARYDRCDYDSLVTMGQSWTHWEVVPLFENARYIEFSRVLQSLYVMYEELLVRHDLRGLATHYIVVGEA